jgi:hypothetical protein
LLGITHSTASSSLVQAVFNFERTVLSGFSFF